MFDSPELKQPAQLESHAAGAGGGWQGTCRGAFPPPALSLLLWWGALIHVFRGWFWYHPKAWGRGGRGVKDNMQGKAGEGRFCVIKGSMSLWGDVLWLKRLPSTSVVLYKPRDSTAYENDSHLLFFFFFISHWQNFSPSHLISVNSWMCKR